MILRLKKHKMGGSWTKRTISGVETQGFSFSDINTCTVGKAVELLGTNKWFNLRNTEYEMYGVSFINDNTGTVVGSGGAL